jgi:hypothetical protein
MIRFLFILLFPALLSAQVTLSERLTIISKQLGDGGVHFSVTDAEHDIESLATAMDSLMGSIAPDMPFDLNLQKVGRHLGIYEILGSGSSSSEEDAFWHNRSFMLTSGKHKGLLSLLGQSSQDPVAPAYAPAGIDLILEISLDLRQVEKMARKIAKSFDTEAIDEVGAVFSQELGPEKTISSVPKGMQPRLSLALWMDESNMAEMGPETKIAAPHLVARIDQGKALWELLEPVIKGESEIVEQDGATFYYTTDVIESPWGLLAPHFAWHVPSSTLWFALHKGDLQKCWSDGEKLVTSDAYIKATAKLPLKTNANAYFSADGVALLSDLMTMAQGMIDDEMGEKMLEFMAPLLAQADSPHGYAATVTVLKNGILSATNAPMPSKGTSAMGPGMIGTVAVLAGLTTPAVLKAKTNADKVKEINNMKQISTAIIEYDSKFDAYPSELLNLVKEGILEEEAYHRIVNPNVVYRGQKLEGMNFAKSADIVLYLELPDGDEVIFGNADGSVGVLPLDAFRKRLAKQKK